jgi:hypothetical protein
MYKSGSCPDFDTAFVKVIKATPTPPLVDPLPPLKLTPLLIHRNLQQRIPHKSKHTTPFDTPPVASPAPPEDVDV